MIRMHFSVNRFSGVFALAAALSASISVAHADAWDKKTIVTFPQSVEVPGAVLGPGKYVMKLVDLTSQRHVIQFSNERESHVFATALALPAYRTRATDDTVLTFYEARAGEPQALRTWYYPGDIDGQEFVYPRGRISQIAAVTRDSNHDSFVPRGDVTPAPATAPSEASSQPNPVKELTSPTAPAEVATPSAESNSNAPVEIAQAQDLKRDEPVQIAQNNAQTPAELPKTASQVSSVALLGFLSAGGALAVRRLRRRVC